MMATLPTPPQSVEATATPDLRSRDGSHDVENTSPDARAGPEVNGEPSAAVVDKLVNEIVDEVVNSAEVSISGGSDTEASKTDHSKRDDKGHIRASSVKKPTTFKSVSVNKTFLASKGASSSVASKVGEKPTSASSSPVPTSASATPKPRLVAKSGGGLRDASKSSLAQNGRPAPDGNAVWNKNRPVPPPDPKKFTDEELAKIGIHMANRLHPDDTKGQSTWADIDDDDEDWAAPEAITWNDGTKTTISHAEEAANTPEPPAVKENKPIDKPRSPAPSTGSPAVKPGVLASGKGLILKGAPEKPTLVAKPPAPPTPVKSPWAALPPVPKASPMDVSSEQPQRGLPPPGQAYGPQRIMPPAAREIAADDFSRSPRRDNRELYNSHSGRYEPVPDRRGMSRSDFQRQPAVLQRPMHSETQGPAEPSAAFQTSHTSGNYGNYGRRRNSSNVSGGSGGFQRIGRPFEQAMPPPEIMDARRGSHTAASDYATSPHDLSHPAPASQSGSRQPDTSPWQSRASPVIPFAAPQIPGGGEPPIIPEPSMDDDVAFQKQLMKERREEAVRRRQEEEAREEAAKRERLAKKLEALGPAPERKSVKKEAVKETPAASAVQPSETTQNPPFQQEAKDVKDLKDVKDVKPPVTSPIAPTEDKQDSLPNGVLSDSQTQSPATTSSEQLAAPENKHGHPWQPRLQNQPDRLWGPGSQSTRNVWGAPNNNRTLGNGTFNSVPSTQPSQLPPIQGNRPGPGPIAPPGSVAKSSGSTPRIAPIGPPQRNRPASEEITKMRSKWISGTAQLDDDLLAKRQKDKSELEERMRAEGKDYADFTSKIEENFTSTRKENQGQRGVREAVEWLQGNNAQNSASSWSVSQSKQDAGQRATTTQAVGQNGTAAALSQHSRFFPPSRDVQQADALGTDRTHSASPPPPDMDGHPAFDGDAAHPNVLLPRTKPVVKLPPAPAATSAASQRPPQSASRWASSTPLKDDGTIHAQPSRTTFVASNTSLHQAPASQTDWQNRFRQLLSDPVPPSVDSSSKTTLAQPSHPASVSLPVVLASSTLVDASVFVTKIMDEECFEEQEMGSLPPVHLPTQVPDSAWEPAKPPPRQDRRVVPVASTSAEAMAFIPEGKLHFIRLPGMMGRKSVAVTASSRSPSNPRRSRGGSRYASSHRGGNRNRDVSGPYSPEQTSASGSNPGRGGRGGYRGRPDHPWSRAAPTPIQTQ